MSLEEIITCIEDAWRKGVLYEARRGVFDISGAHELISCLKQVATDWEDCIPRRLVELLWFIPQFLDWQEHRIRTKSMSELEEFQKFTQVVLEEVRRILGVP